ncbi:unnamed protein product [Phytophthora fragariaefolia]|uniref:Unnamed protein product n=1 Tax=Phytophthora fragariaefolia TaxID=1490495 RepID=A0A9W6XE20_9STRA|nr:unnamed protein product [Phytophthora fragariaefolia]
MNASARTPRSPRSPLQQPVDREAVVTAVKTLPPLVRHLLLRTLEGLGQRDTPVVSVPLGDKAHEVQQQNNSSMQHESALDNFKDVSTKPPAAGLNVALETLGIAEFTARFGASFVAAVYEHICILDPISFTRKGPLVPATFWSSTKDCAVKGLGLEMAVTRPS